MIPSQGGLRGVAGAVAVAVAVVVSGLAGCGGTPPPSSSASSDEARVAALYRRLAQCIREHGVPDFRSFLSAGVLRARGSK